MLKDLETRSSQFTPIDIASVESAVAHKPRQNNTWLITLIILLLTAGLVFLYSQLYYNQVEPVMPLEKVSHAAVPLAPVKVVDAPITAPVNQIIGLQIRESADSLSLEFSLQEKVVSYLKERSENKFVYHLKDIQSEIVAPLIKDNQWIEQLSIKALDEGVDITFRTTSRVLVETRQHLQADEQIWAIKLKNSPEPIARIKPVEISPKLVAVQPVKKQVEPKKSDARTQSETEIEPPVEAKVVKLEIKSSQRELSATEQLKRAEILLKNRRWAEAEKLLKGLINGPEDLAARIQLIGILAQTGKSDQYSALLGESINRYPQQALFKTEYARSLIKLNAYQSAIDYLQPIDDANATQLALLAASYQRLDQHQQAVQIYKKSLEMDRQQTKNWIALGISQEQTAQLQEALQSYRAASKLGNMNARLQAFVAKRTKQLEQTLN
jgi:tetratricopeptide (TPR) repeat protein